MVLLLVEDEPYTREGILTEIDWDLLGITKVLTAEDGKEGLEMAESIHLILFLLICTCQKWMVPSCQRLLGKYFLTVH